MAKITKNFNEEEFTCKCGHCMFSVPIPGLVDLYLVRLLQNVRDKLKAPVYVTSGRRCPRWNKKVSQTSNSFHVRGAAADICADDMLRLADIVCGVAGFQYVELHDTYIHVDIGKKRNNRINDLRTVKRA